MAWSINWDVADQGAFSVPVGTHLRQARAGQ
jgi:chitinase